MKKRTSSLPISFRDLIGRADIVELMRLFHFEAPAKAKQKALASLMDEYDETVLGVCDRIKTVAEHIMLEQEAWMASEQGHTNPHRREGVESLISSLLLVAASARINETIEARSQEGFSSVAAKRMTFSSVKGIVFNLDGKPQAGMTVVLESEDPFNTQPLVCMKTNQAGRIPVTHELPEGHYMMTILHNDYIERQPIFIGQPKGSKPEGSVGKLA